MRTDPLPVPEDLPPPSAHLVLWRASIQAFIATSSRKRSERFLRVLAEQLAAEENLSEVFSIRPQTEQAEVRKVRRQAAEIFRRYAPIFLAGITRD